MMQEREELVVMSLSRWVGLRFHAQGKGWPLLRAWQLVSDTKGESLNDWVRARSWVDEEIAPSGVSFASQEECKGAHQWFQAFLKRWGSPQSILPSPSQVLCPCTPGKDRRWSGDFKCLHVFIYSFIHSVLRAYFVPGTMLALQIKL